MVWSNEIIELKRNPDGAALVHYVSSPFSIVTAWLKQSLCECIGVLLPGASTLFTIYLQLFGRRLFD